jgi:hypothetical protein
MGEFSAAQDDVTAGPELGNAYLPPAGGPSPKVRTQQLRQELAFARCMRAHRVPNFPDPSSSGGRVGLSVVIDPQSPAFRIAARVCGAGGANIEIGG